jgi:hypothetical protein
MIKSLSGFDSFPLEMVGVEGKYKEKNKEKSLLVNAQKLQTMIEKSFDMFFTQNIMLI